jgi:chemotaxis protein MotB
MARRRIHEEHQSHEAWAIPFGDLLTLLLAFFVTMYAISSVNAGKYRVLSDSLNSAFHGTPNSPEPVSLEMAPSNISEHLPITEVNRMFTAGLPADLHMPLPQAHGLVHHGQSSPGAADPRDLQSKAQEQFEIARTAELNKVEADVNDAMNSVARNNNVQVKRRGNNIEVQISTDILFSSGEAQLGAGAQAVLQGLADALKPWPNSVRVEGHTDDRPIRTAQFLSNWELSAARAASVVRLFADHGVDPKRMAVVGYGEFAPMQPNTTITGRNANRRVVVVILGRDS